jgi:hypothetical protein
MRRLATLGCALAVALVIGPGGCSGDDRPPSAAPPPPLVFADAGVAPPLPAEPADGELDDISGSRREWRTGTRPRRPLEITLRSTPSGATAAVDGVIVGRTPALWEGEFTGREREFTFVLPGYSMARYRFAPITSGVVHGRLERMGDGDAGVPQIPQPELPHRPPAASRPAPPPAEDTHGEPAPAEVDVDAAAEAAAPAPTPAPAPAPTPEPAPAPAPAPAAADTPATQPN